MQLELMIHSSTHPDVGRRNNTLNVRQDVFLLTGGWITEVSVKKLSVFPRHTVINISNIQHWSLFAHH